MPRDGRGRFRCRDRRQGRAGLLSHAEGDRAWLLFLRETGSTGGQSIK